MKNSSYIMFTSEDMRYFENLGGQKSLQGPTDKVSARRGSFSNGKNLKSKQEVAPNFEAHSKFETTIRRVIF